MLKSFILTICRFFLSHPPPVTTLPGSRVTLTGCPGGHFYPTKFRIGQNEVLLERKNMILAIMMHLGGIRILEIVFGIVWTFKKKN